MSLTVGALFYGYGGIELGLRSVTPDLDLSWYAEFDPKASLIGAHHHPGVPNLGDVTKVDWTAVPKVDVITGGSPCQDLSHAGKRKGMTDGTRSNLWVEMREAIATIRPRLVVWENVRGALSAAADSDLEPCPGCMGGADDGPVLRALGRVLGDLAELGYDANWYGLRAADVGAPHGRFRVFLFATPADADSHGLEGLGRLRAVGRDAHGLHREGQAPAGLTLLPTPAAQEPGGTAEQYHARLSRHDGRESTFLPLSMAVRLLQTPTTTQRGTDANLDTREGAGVNLHHAVTEQDWREYEPAIRRWEALTRPAPPPTEPGAKGQPRLSPTFVEWMQGLPLGHVTDVPGLTRNDQLKGLGNGVCPQQCAAAYRAFLTDHAAEQVAS